MINIYDSKCQVFQVDSDIVKGAYNTLDNYLIENTSLENGDKKVCAIYFSGHSIYFPNNEDAFSKNILIKNRFEWYGQRVPQASKHIFVRDIHKQWYLSGINGKINTPDSMLKFFKSETHGYDVICIGSSAGGYAAILYGVLLNAKIVYAFSPRIYMRSLDGTSDETKNPLYFRLKNTDRERFFDLSPFIKQSHSKIYCYYPTDSSLDNIQLKHIECNELESNKNFHIVKLKTKKHGVPFPKVALNNIISSNLPVIGVSKAQNPFMFSVRQVGFNATIKGILRQFRKHITKK